MGAWHVADTLRTLQCETPPCGAVLSCVRREGRSVDLTNHQPNPQPSPPEQARVLSAIAIDNCQQAPRGGGVKGGTAAERSEDTLDAAEHGGTIHRRWPREALPMTTHR